MTANTVTLIIDTRPLCKGSSVTRQRGRGAAQSWLFPKQIFILFTEMFGYAFNRYVPGTLLSLFCRQVLYKYSLIHPPPLPATVSLSLSLPLSLSLSLSPHTHTSSLPPPCVCSVFPFLFLVSVMTILIICKVSRSSVSATVGFPCFWSSLWTCSLFIK